MTQLLLVRLQLDLSGLDWLIPASTRLWLSGPPSLHSPAACSWTHLFPHIYCMVGLCWVESLASGLDFQPECVL